MTATLASNRARVGSLLSDAEARALESRFVLRDAERPAWQAVYAAHRRRGPALAIEIADAAVNEGRR